MIYTICTNKQILNRAHSFTTIIILLCFILLIASTNNSTPAQCCMSRIFRRKDAPPILRGCISIIRRKRWKAQICDKGSTPKWALGGHPPPPNLGPCETLMAKWWRSCHTLLPTPSTTNEHAPFLDLRHIHLLKIRFPCQLFDEITFFALSEYSICQNLV